MKEKKKDDRTESSSSIKTASSSIPIEVVIYYLLPNCITIQFGKSMWKRDVFHKMIERILKIIK